MATVLNYDDNGSAVPDIVLYVVTDCEDMANTCIAAADDAYAAPQDETISFDAPHDGWYYLIVDGYYADECATGLAIFIDNPIATDDVSFGSMKAMYR